MLGRADTFGQAYNACQDETPTLAELVALLAEPLGAEARIAGATAAEMAAAGLDPVAASPFSTRWKSFLDPARAKRELGLRHPPLRESLGRTVASLLASWNPDPPAGYAQRPLELAFARGRA